MPVSVNNIRRLVKYVSTRTAQQLNALKISGEKLSKGRTKQRIKGPQRTAEKLCLRTAYY